MSTVAEHYERHLAPIYVWMTGGIEAALHAGGTEIDALRLPIAPGSAVLDLGAGFGVHSIPLARKGMSVTAIDFSAELLRVLSELQGELPVRAINDDLLEFPRHITEPPAAILLMGDTIAHLPGRDDVERLIGKAFAELRPGGMLVVSLRDYAIAQSGDQRFIPVRSDDTRILTCFLEYEPDAVVVHDIIHERTPDGWQTKISHYSKLRLAPEHLAGTLEANGFRVRRETGMNGMVRLVAQKC